MPGGGVRSGDSEYKREVAGFGFQQDPQLVLRHQLMLPQGGISSSGHMLQRLLQQQRQQTQQQFLLQQQQAQMPKSSVLSGTSSSIPLTSKFKFHRDVYECCMNEIETSISRRHSFGCSHIASA